VTELPDSRYGCREGFSDGQGLPVDESGAWLALGKQRLVTGDGAGARECFFAALALERRDALAWLGLGQSYLAVQPPRLGLAAEAFAEALALDERLVAAYLGLASVAELRGAWSEAYALWISALSVCHTTPEAYAGLVRYHEKMGDGPRVLAVMTDWLLSGCADLLVLEQLVNLAPAHDAISDALEVLAKLFEQETLAVEWLAGVGRSFQLLGQLECARAAYQRAVNRQPNHLTSWRAIGQIEMALGHLSQALTAFQTVFSLSPTSAESAYDLAVAQLENGLHADAVGSFGKALLLAPHWVEARTGLGWAMLQDSRYSGARACFELALSVQPTHAPAWDGLGTTFWKLGQLDQAIESMQRASELTPFESGDGYREKWGMLLTARAEGATGR